MFTILKQGKKWKNFNYSKISCPKSKIFYKGAGPMYGSLTLVSDLF